jgi:4,5-dihydroxyphthalate decarboxylase
MSPSIHLSLAVGDYDINRGLVDGTVKPQGIDLTVLTYPTPPRQWRMDRHSEFDAAEFSMSSYLAVVDREMNGGELLMEPVAAIPAFPHRRFRHSFIFVNSGAGIDTPKDLEGRRVGLRTWQATAGLWARGILADEYGVDLRQVIWLTSDAEAIPAPAPKGFDVTRLPEGRSVTAMLLDGALDALIYPEMPKGVLSGDSRIRRLFPEYKRVEMAYYEKTKLFPIMHTVVIKKAILDRDPWVARNLLLAFRESKDLAFSRMLDPRSISLAWVRDLIEEQQRVLGDDPWAYSFEANRVALETMIRFSADQGIISRALAADTLFVPSTLDELPAYQ